MTDRQGPLALATGGLLALALSVGIGRFVYTPILPVMTEALGLSRAAGGLVASANLLGYLLGALAAAVPWPGLPRRAALVVALAACTLTTAAMGAASGLPAFLALRLVGGFAAAIVFVLAAAIVLDGLARAGRPGLAALHFSGVGIGILVSAATVSALLHAGYGWRALWFACGVLSALASLAVVRLVPDAPGPAAPAPAAPAPASTGEAEASWRFPAYVVGYGLYGFGYIITATFLVAIVRADPSLRPVEAAIWPVVGVAAAPSIMIWLLVERRIGLRAAFALACLVEAASVVMSVTWLSEPGLLVSGALLGGTFVALTALGFVGARRMARGDPSRALAMMTASFGAGQVIGPIFAGVLADRTGSLFAPSLAAAAALLVSAVLALLAGRRADADAAQ